MKVGEVRTKLKAYKKDELQQLIVEMYKAIPKEVRENKEIDQLIDNPNYLKQKKRSEKQHYENMDFFAVKQDVESFIEHAYQQYYIAPNRMVPKKERSNWRFTAKRLIDQVLAFTTHPNYKEKSVELYQEIYQLLCYASSHYVFASDEPFSTLKTTQADFFEQIILLKKRIEDPDKWISDSLKLVLDHDLDRYTLKIELLAILLEALNNAPLKERAIEIAEVLLREKRSKIGRINKKTIKYHDEQYLNTLVEMIFITKSELGEYKDAIAFFQKYYLAIREEIKLYVLLDFIEADQRIEEWLEVYEDAVKKKVEPREVLEYKYKYIKKEKAFPDSMYIF